MTHTQTSTPSIAEVRSKFGQKFIRSVEQYMKEAKPAEKRWTFEDFYKLGDPEAELHLLQQHGDGLWLCCCGYENILTHHQGAFPFKYLHCGKCEHILCDTCFTTEILTPERLRLVSAHDSTQARPEMNRRCFVCSTCGLSHRGNIYDGGNHQRQVPCTCGLPSVGPDLQFTIGTVNGWRLNQPGKTQELTDRRREQQLLDGVKALPPGRHLRRVQHGLGAVAAS